ncbi:MAG: hypothetical protein ABH810_01245 [bacterium]
MSSTKEKTPFPDDIEFLELAFTTRFDLKVITWKRAKGLLEAMHHPVLVRIKGREELGVVSRNKGRRFYFRVLHNLTGLRDRNARGGKAYSIGGVLEKTYQGLRSLADLASLDCDQSRWAA